MPGFCEGRTAVLNFLQSTGDGTFLAGAVNSSLSEKNGIFCLPCVYYHTAAAAPER